MRSRRLYLQFFDEEMSMLFILRFTNDPTKADLVGQHYPAHVEWLRERKSVVLVPGAIRKEPDAPPVGGLWIVQAESKAEVEELFRTDPFWVNGLREGYEILYWNKAFPDQKVPV
jgi:uncharacterized protein YciI